MYANNISIACELELSHYEKIFEIIHEEYINYCMEWQSRISDSYNLKNTYISNIYNNDNGIDIKFKIYMDSYIDGLNRLYFGIMARINRECGITIRGRVKDPQSILGKIHKKFNQGDGKFQLIRCLNDLLGIRIVDINYEINIDKIKLYLDSVDYKVRHKLTENNDYIGYHIYFRGDKNIYFPMELQVWNSQNEQTNNDSHTIYKQNYISWAENYRKFNERGE